MGFVVFWEDFIYLREIMNWEGAKGQRERENPLSREPDTGRDPRTLRS